MLMGRSANCLFTSSRAATCTCRSCCLLRTRYYTSLSRYNKDNSEAPCRKDADGYHCCNKAHHRILSQASAPRPLKAGGIGYPPPAMYSGLGAQGSSGVRISRLSNPSLQEQLSRTPSRTHVKIHRFLSGHQAGSVLPVSC